MGVESQVLLGPGLFGWRGEGLPVCMCGYGLEVLLVALCTHTDHWHLDKGERGRDGAVATRQIGVETGGASVC